jgi:hypothetical protein
VYGYSLEVVGWDRRYDNYKNREAKLVYRDGKLYLMITKEILKPPKYTPRGILAVDINERQVVVGNPRFEPRLETAVERALHYKRLAEELQKKYSSTRYRAWLRRRGILNRIKYFYRRARNIIETGLRKHRTR